VKPATAALRLASFNLQYGAERRWLGKRAELLELLRALEADVLCLQEVSAAGFAWLRAQLGRPPAVGVGREDGAAAGEHVPVLVLDPRWRLQAGGTFWLSPTPGQPSRGWGAAHPRICTWARLRGAGPAPAELVVANVHLDHRSRRAREEGARLLRSRLDQAAGGAPVVLCGDFNCRERSRAYALLTAGPRGLLDAGAALGQRQPTWDGWGLFPVGRARIDYCFLDPALTVEAYAVRENRLRGRRLSDHHPVVVDLRVNPPLQPTGF